MLNQFNLIDSRNACLGEFSHGMRQKINICRGLLHNPDLLILDEPILGLDQMAKNISELDFSKRYEGNEKDEVGRLGESMNIISEKLDRTIGDLKNEMALQQRFLASVSHEFKTPVGLIKGYTESLELGLASSDEETQEFYEIIIGEADRLDHLISDIIYLMQLNSVNFRIDMKEFNFSHLLIETVNKLKTINDDKTYELTMDIMRIWRFMGMSFGLDKLSKI